MHTANFANFQFEDFIADGAFVRWAKNPTAATTAFWEKVAAENPHQRPVMEAAKRAILQLNDALKPEGGTETDAATIWSVIEKRIAEPAQKPKPAVLRPVWRWAAAASITGLLGLFGWLTIRDAVPVGPVSMVKISVGQSFINGGENPRPLALPDGSTVLLEKNSRIEYKTGENGQTRIVHLSGGAQFDVVKNPECPFVVLTENLVTKVLGTTFRIRAFEADAEVRVDVLRGRVSVFSDKKGAEASGLILSPNQQAVFQKSNDRLQLGLVEKPVAILSDETMQRFVFEDSPVAEIFAALEKAYGVEIQFDADGLKNCALTTKLSHETLFEKLAVICKSIGATYKVVGARVVIDGKNCR